MTKSNFAIFALAAAVLLSSFVFLLQPGQAAAAGTPNLAGSYERNLGACRVTNPSGAQATVVSTGQSVFLPSGASLNRVGRDMHQGMIAVRALVRRRYLTLSIDIEDTNCR